MQFWSPRGTYREGEAPYDIFKDRVSAINSIVGAVKANIANKYWDQLNKVTISEIGKKLSKDKEFEILNLYNSEPPDNIYPQNLEEVSGQFVDYTVGTMLGKEIMMGRLPAPTAQTGVPSGVIPTGTLPGVAPTASQEVMIPQINKQALLDSVMSGGQMDWSNILKTIENRPSFLGEYSDLEKTALQGAMGKDVMGELETGIKRANLISDYFAEPEKARITNEIEFAREDPEGWRNFLLQKESLNITNKEKDTQMYIGMFNRKEITRDELMKLIGGYVAPAKLSDWEKKWNMFLKIYEDNNMEVPLDNALKILDAYVKEETGTTGTEPKTPTYTTAEKIEEGFMEKVETIQDFGNELKRLQGLNIDISMYETTEYFAGLMEKKHKEMMDFVKYAFDKMTAGEEMHEKSGKSYRDLYKEYWEKANNYDQQYFNITGKHLLKGE